MLLFRRHSRSLGESHDSHGVSSKSVMSDFPDQGLAGLGISTDLSRRGATGIGKETAMQLFQHNAKVYIASRSRTKFDELVEETQELSKIGAVSVTSGSVEFLQLDLSDIKSCVGAARRFLDLEKRLDVIVANAALSVVVRASLTLNPGGGVFLTSAFVIAMYTFQRWG